MTDETREVRLQNARVLQMDLGANVLVEPYGSLDLQFRTEFAGMQRFKFVCVRLPLTRKILESLPMGRRLTVRYLHSGGQIYGFETAVAHIMVKPFSLLFMDYPKTVEVMSLRKHDRVNCYLPVTLYHDVDEYQGAIVDISSGGCMVHLQQMDKDTLPAVGTEDKVLCQFNLFNSGREVAIGGTVKSATKQGSKLDIGVKFDHLSVEVQESVERYVRDVRDFLLT